MLIVTDLATLTGDTADGVGSATAQLLWRTDRTPVELTTQAAQRLACDATQRHVPVDGADVLGVGASHPKVSTKPRAALEVRDSGCPRRHRPAQTPTCPSKPKPHTPGRTTQRPHAMPCGRLNAPDEPRCRGSARHAVRVIAGPSTAKTPVVEADPRRLLPDRASALELKRGGRR